MLASHAGLSRGPQKSESSKPFWTSMTISAGLVRSLVEEDMA